VRKDYGGWSQTKGIRDHSWGRQAKHEGDYMGRPGIADNCRGQETTMSDTL